MKQCPKCGSTYTDDGLRFCLTDGTRLTAASDDNETVVAGRGATVRVDMPSAPTTGGPRASRSSAGKFFAIGGVLGLLLIVLMIGLAGVGIYLGFKNSAKVEDKPQNKISTPTPIATTTPDSEKERLQSELANIQKRLAEDEKNSNRPAPAQPTPNSPGAVTARVNSPNDGFLALRSQPSSTSELIVKVPHGDMVTIENCNRSKVAIGGRQGRWCLISWNGYQGYVFDAWLIY